MDITERPTIMVVDDDRDLLKSLSFLLEHFGFNVEARATPPTWIDLQAVHPSLLFLDVEVMGQNGVQVCKSIKENLCGWKLPVVLISGHPEEQLQREAHLCHADAILPKPFTTGAFKRLADHFARGHQDGKAVC